MSTIVVEPAALEQLAARLEQVAADLGAAGHQLRQGAGAAGPAELVDAVEELCAAWHEALRRTAEAGSAAGAQLRAAAACYAQTDSVLAGTTA